MPPIKGEAKSSAVITPKNRLPRRSVAFWDKALATCAERGEHAADATRAPARRRAGICATTDTPAPKTDVAIATPTRQRGDRRLCSPGRRIRRCQSADELVATLKSSGFATYTEAVPTAQGSVQRVRVGPFATRAAADAAVAKLKLAGHDRAMVTNTK